MKNSNQEQVVLVLNIKLLNILFDDIILDISFNFLLSKIEASNFLIMINQTIHL